MTNRFKWLKWPLAALVVLFLVIAVTQMDFDDLLASLRRIPAWAAVLLFALQIVSQLLVNLQWRFVAKGFGSPITFMQMLHINARADLLHIAPAGHISGGVFRVMQISRGGCCDGTQAAAAVAIQKLFSLSAFFTISLISIGFFAGQVPWLQDTALRFLLYAVLLTILAMMACVYAAPRRIANWLNRPRRKHKHKQPRKWASKLHNFALAAVNHIAELHTDKRRFAVLGGLALCIWVIYPLKLHLLAMQIVPEISITHIAAATFLSYSVAMLPIFPAGLGGFEATMAGLLLLMGFVQSDAVVVTVLFRFATFWFVIALNLVFIALYSICTKKRRRFE